MRFACPWEAIDRFQNLVEFRSFERWIAGQVSAGMARQVRVEQAYAGHAPMQAEVVEVWYMHVMSREVWRLVWPEPPFDGVFQRIP
ncbi:hypothetical protein [Massilia sp. 9096]|uniref:hypothetical protein n=1 Tax=Massilia sp. 9096 TaxID=1500894 RepID=UPI00056C1AF2|nr:hypothetical protein [Massilia sp. 9096]